MITRIEIDGFKTFENFTLDLQPFTAIVGPNASGKSNLFDALKFISQLASNDVRTAMQNLRGNPEELFRTTPHRMYDRMSFAVEVFLDSSQIDDFGALFYVKARRLRYEFSLKIKKNSFGIADGIFVDEEHCSQIPKSRDSSKFIQQRRLRQSYRKTPFISTESNPNRAKAFVIRQDGEAESGISKRGRPVRLAAEGATRTALSTVTTSEFPHLYALRSLLESVNFLEINPSAARLESDRFDKKDLKSDASNLAAALAHIREISADDVREDGAITDISMDLSFLIPSVKKVIVDDDRKSKDYSFSIETSDGLRFSSRVISDGTIRLLALLSVLNNPYRTGVLCFEEPENGVHEGRIPTLIQILRDATTYYEDVDSVFQIVINTHSPAVLASLEDSEIVVADIITKTHRDTRTSVLCSRMRTGVQEGVLELDSEKFLTRPEISRILKKSGAA